MRDNAWLNQKLNQIWNQYFFDVERKNEVRIRFGRWAKYQFGVISFDRKLGISVITINRMFTTEIVPEAVVEHTIAHELVHYSHGFSSTLKRLHKYPHHGGIVNKELSRRGASHLIVQYRMWLKAYRKRISASR